MSYPGKGADLSEHEAFFLFEVACCPHLNWREKSFSRSVMLAGITDHPHYEKKHYSEVDRQQLRGKLENVPQAQLEAIWYFYIEQLEEGELTRSVQFKIRDRMLNHYGNY